MAIVGFAAFSPATSSPTRDTATTIAVEATPDVSARVASAVLALRVTDAGSRVATTTAQRSPRPEAATEQQTQQVDVTITTVPVTTTAGDVAEDAASEPEAAVAAATPTTTEQRDTTPPPIRVTSPGDGDTVTSSVVTFSGTSEPGATVASGPYAATMSDNGEWTIKLSVVDGANGASFTATDDAGNSASSRIVVHYSSPATTTTKASTTTTKASVTTTTAASVTTTTSGSSSKWSPNWPADAGGIRDVENWRSAVEQYWPANRVDCALGIIKRESNGDPRAYNSGSSAEGLMQHLSKYWVSRATGAGFVDGNGLVATPYNGAANIAAGAYLANYYDGAIGQWWNPWKSNGQFTATYGSCTSSNPG